MSAERPPQPEVVIRPDEDARQLHDRLTAIHDQLVVLWEEAGANEPTVIESAKTKRIETLQRLQPEIADLADKINNLPEYFETRLEQQQRVIDDQTQPEDLIQAAKANKAKYEAAQITITEAAEILTKIRPLQEKLS